MTTFYSPTSLKLKHQVVSSVEITEAGKNYGGSNIVEYKGEPHFNLMFNYWVDKETLEIIIEKYNALKTYI